MSEELPAPLVEPRVDCSDLDGFMLNAERLMSSELLALYGNEIIGAALLLWCRAWKQRPAASLPDDDRVNAAFARLPLPKYRKVKEAVLRGFVKCSDGRLYHKFLSGEANKAYARKVQFQQKRAGDAKRLKEWREAIRETPNVAVPTNDETRDETRFVADGNGKDRDRDRDRDNYLERPPSVGSKSPKKGTRLSAEWRPNEADWADACKALGSGQAKNELAKFRDYWPAKPGKEALKLDWNATWRNWVRSANERLPTRTAVPIGPAEPSIDLGGEFREVLVRNLPGIVQVFDEKGTWHFPSPKPGQPGCRVPSKFIPTHLHRKEAAA